MSGSFSVGKWIVVSQTGLCCTISLEVMIIGLENVGSPSLMDSFLISPQCFGSSAQEQNGESLDLTKFKMVRLCSYGGSG